MAISITSITPVFQNDNGKWTETVATVVVTGTYSAGGTALTAAQKQQLGVDGKVMWQVNDPANPHSFKYNSATGNVQLFAITDGGAELGAVSGAGTYSMKISSVGGTGAAPAMI